MTGRTMGAPSRGRARHGPWAMAAVLLLLAAGCQSGSSPEAVGRSFFDAMCGRDFEVAYALLEPAERESVVGPAHEFVRMGEEELGFLGSDRSRLCAVRDVVDFQAFTAQHGVLVLELELLTSDLGMAAGTVEQVDVSLVRVDGDWYVDPYTGMF